MKSTLYSIWQRRSWVAPARERGLKLSSLLGKTLRTSGRSREGAWIEILGSEISTSYQICRSREGAWIEIYLFYLYFYTIYRRSREGAWIEIKIYICLLPIHMVAPARERGLKLRQRTAGRATCQRRSREGAWIEIQKMDCMRTGWRTSLPRGSVD